MYVSMYVCMYVYTNMVFVASYFHSSPALFEVYIMFLESVSICLFLPSVFYSPPLVNVGDLVGQGFWVLLQGYYRAVG